MKKICVVTATRAEYGLLKPVMQRIKDDNDLKLQLVVTGMHLSQAFGLTFSEIVNDGFAISAKIDICINATNHSTITNSMAMVLKKFPKCFEELAPDMILILGDRFEMFAVASVATVMQIPIAHMYGGETTEGAFDEAFRHAITKMSYLHFTSTKKYQKRVVQLGESPDRTFCVGATGTENIVNLKLLSREELEGKIGFKFSDKTAMVTFHPVTLENHTAGIQFKNLLNALDKFQDLRIIFTKANADTEGNIINRMIDQYVRDNKTKSIEFASMGQLRYLSSLQFVSVVIGNSSSGIVEVPSFGKPSINIGDRQKGRIKSGTVINCGTSEEDIIQAVKKGLSDEFKEEIKGVKNPYESNNSSKQIVERIKLFILEGKMDLKKKFYDIEFEDGK